MLEIHCQRVSGSWRFLFIHFPLRGVLWIQIIFKIICEHALWLLLLFCSLWIGTVQTVKSLFKLYGVFHRPNPKMAHRACPQPAHWPGFLLSRAPDSAPAMHFQGYLNTITFIHVSFVQTILEAGFPYGVKTRMLLLGCKRIYKLPTWSVTPGLSSSWADVNESTNDFINRHLLMNFMLAMIYFPC